MSENRDSTLKNVKTIIDWTWFLIALAAAIRFHYAFSSIMFLQFLIFAPVEILLGWILPFTILFIWKKIRGKKLTLTNIRICSIIALFLPVYAMSSLLSRKEYLISNGDSNMGIIVVIYIIHWLAIKIVRNTNGSNR